MGALVAGLRGLASGMTVDGSIDGLAVKFGDMGAAFEAVKLGMGAKSEADAFQARMSLDLDGLALPGMPEGPLAKLAPRRLALRPFVNGLGTPELSRIAIASSQGRKPDPADIAGLYDHGGVTTGLESMALELGGATFTGNLKLTATSPKQTAGTGQVAASNFDALLQAIRDLPPEVAQALPQLSFAMPALAFAKGISRAVGDQLVWDISYDNGKVLVNDVDLAAMMGGAGGTPRR